MYYKVSKKEMAQLALNSLKEILKRRKSISDLLVMALPERVVAGLSTPSSSSMNARMTSLDSSLSPESMQSFSFSSSLLLSLPPLSSSSLSLLSLSGKGSLSASSQFLFYFSISQIIFCGRWIHSLFT